MLKYISIGAVTKPSTEHIVYVSHSGYDYTLTGDLAAMWLNGRFGFDAARNQLEETALNQLVRMGLVVVTEDVLEGEYLGNSTIFLGFGEDTGEPFMVMDFGILSLDASASHVVSVIPVNSVYKLDAKYLPDEAATKEYVREEISKIEASGGGSTVTEAASATTPPEFDLAAMGLPALPIDGSSVSVECDTADLREALGKNVVKLLFTANVGMEMAASGVVSALHMGAAYQCSFIGCLYDVPMVLSFEITETMISGSIKTLATTT